MSYKYTKEVAAAKSGMNSKTARKYLLSKQLPSETRLDRFEVLIIDDISYIPYEKSKSDVLFVLLAERSLILVCVIQTVTLAPCFISNCATSV